MDRNQVQAADALLEAFGWKPSDDTTQAEVVRAYAGALLIYKGIRNIVAIREALTPSK
jgi:hypothetical protein